MKSKIDTSEVDKMLDKLKLMPEGVMDETYVYFRNQTPIRSGNAKNRTKQEGKLKIGARYPYAGRLDEGWSKQAPKGMTEPSSDKFEKSVGNSIFFIPKLFNINILRIIISLHDNYHLLSNESLLHFIV